MNELLRMKTLLTNILPTLIIALGLCGAAWIYARATRYAAANVVSGKQLVLDHWTGHVLLPMSSRLSSATATLD